MRSYRGVVVALSIVSSVLFGQKMPSAASVAESAEPVLTISVATRVISRYGTPVSLATDELAGLPGDIQLVEIRDDRTVPTPYQLAPGNPPTLWWIVNGTSSPREKRTYELRAGKPVKSAPVNVAEDDGFLTVSLGDAQILRYAMKHVDPPKEIGKDNGRSAHLHPVWTPSGQVVTDEFPPDHPHQSGVFFAFAETRFEGRSPDFWNLPVLTGRVRFAEKLRTVSGPVFGEFAVRHEHVDLTEGSVKVALNEVWNVRVWNVGGKGSGFWIYDVHSTVKTATDSPLELPEFHYGGMGVRGGREWTPENCEFLTSNGKTRKNGNHDRAAWVDMSGKTGEQWSGITVMSSPENFRFPQPVRIQDRMPYMVYTPQQLGEFRITSGEPYVAHFRYVIHDGKLDPKLAEQLWQDFVEPPLATVVK